jgi:hypothetical protein
VHMNDIFQLIFFCIIAILSSFFIAIEVSSLLVLYLLFIFLMISFRKDFMLIVRRYF